MLEKTIKEFLDWKILNNDSDHNEISPRTINLYGDVLRYFFTEIGNNPDKITESNFNNYLLKLKPRTRNNYSTIIKLFYRWYYRDNIDKLPNFIKNHKNRKIRINEIEYRKKLVSDGEYEKLIEFSTKPIQRAIIECLRICGARKTMITDLKVEDVYYEDSNTVVVITKSKTEPRRIFYPDRAEYLLKWKETLTPNRNNPKGFLFVTIRNNKIKHVNYNYCYDTLKDICKRANIRHIKPHDFRHTWFTEKCKIMTDQLAKQQGGLSRNSKMLDIYSHTTDNDAKEFYDRKSKDDKVSYELLEKQKKKLEDKHEKEINQLKEEIKELKNAGQYIMKVLSGEISLVKK